MIVNNEIEKFLGLSKELYAKYLESGEGDALSEAGELLWEGLKTDIAQVANTKTENIQTLTKAATQMGETYIQLFFHCYHFHSWYVHGVPNNIMAEKKLYQKSVKSLEKILKNRTNRRYPRKQKLKIAADAI